MESINILQDDSQNFNISHMNSSAKKSKTSQESDIRSEIMDCNEIKTTQQNIIQPSRLVFSQAAPQNASQVQSTSNLDNLYNIPVTNRFGQLTQEHIPQTNTQDDPQTSYIPNLYIYDIEKWHQHSKNLASEIRFSAKARFDNIQLTFEKPEDYRFAINYSRHNNLQYHTYEIDAENKPIKIIIRGLPITTPIQQIMDNLTEQGFKNNKVSQLVSRRTKENLPLFLVTLPNNEHSKNIFNITNILRLVITVEKYKGLSGPSQCYRCQRFGHSANYCTANVRCMKCAKEHHTKDCQKTREVPALCINCGGDHPASYRSCPLYISISKKVKKPQINSNAHRDNQAPQPQNSQIDFPEFTPRYYHKQTPKKTLNSIKVPQQNHQSKSFISYANVVSKTIRKPNTRSESSLTIQEVIREIKTIFDVINQCQTQLQNLLINIMTITNAQDDNNPNVNMQNGSP